MTQSATREITRAYQLGKVIAAIETAAALHGRPDSVRVRTLRLKTAAQIRERAEVIGTAHYSRGRDAAVRQGLALKERLLTHRRVRKARRLPREAVAASLRELILKRATPAELGPGRIDQPTRFQIETP